MQIFFPGGSLKAWALTVGTFLGRYKRDEVTMTHKLDIVFAISPVAREFINGLSHLRARLYISLRRVRSS
jgi:hypothetical protein